MNSNEQSERHFTELSANDATATTTASATATATIGSSQNVVSAACAATSTAATSRSTAADATATTANDSGDARTSGSPYGGSFVGWGRWASDTATATTRGTTRSSVSAVYDKLQCARTATPDDDESVRTIAILSNAVSVAIDLCGPESGESVRWRSAR